MLRPVISKIGPRRRIAVLASACVLATAATLAVIGTASAGAATSGRTHRTHSCRNATLKGTYTYGYNGSSVSGGVSTPVSSAGFDTFSGKGTSTGVTTFVSNGVVENNNTPDTSTYSIGADCAGTIVFNIGGSLAHFNVYVSPSGDSFTLIETDAGSNIAGTETRVTR